MAYTPQTDDGLTAGANTYDTVVAFRTYCTDRGRDVTAYTDSLIQAAGVKATDFMDSRWQYDGYKLADNQTTIFPRADLYDPDSRLVTGVPKVIKNVWAEYTYLALILGDLNEPNDATGTILTFDRKKISSLETEKHYLPGKRFPKYPVPDRMIKATGFVQVGQLGRAG